MKSEIDRITDEVKARFSTTVVAITGSQGTIYFSIDGNSKTARKEMLTVKAQAVGYILDNSTRKWKHAAHNNNRVWWWSYNYSGANAGLRCGVRAKLTDTEHRARLIGPAAWKAIQA